MSFQKNFNFGNTAVEATITKAFKFTVGDILRKNSRIKPNKTALEFEGDRLTFAELNNKVNKLANSFIKLGISRGDRLAILSKNRIEYCETIYAAAKIGIILPLLNFRFSEAELVRNILLTTPETILVSGEYFGKLLSIIDSLPFVKKIISLDEIRNKPTLNGISFYDYCDLIALSDTEEPSNEDVDMEDGLLILYSSGTTGSSKGAVISHRALIARAHVTSSALGLTADDTFIAWPPMSHMASTDQMISTHALGGKVIIMSGFFPEQIVQKLERERIGWLILMPGTIQPVIDELKTKNINVKFLKMVGDMADLVPKSQLSELTTILKAPFVNTFGSTETGSPPATANFIPISSYSLSKEESPFCEIRLVDENYKDVPIGESGTLIMRGPTLFSGYWNDMVTTEKVFKDGWFQTGDILRRNLDGSLDFVDRQKYLIKSGGENIYPAEIETVLKSYPGVQEAVVVRVKDETWGEVPKAYIASNKDIDQVELSNFCRQHLASFKVPRLVEVISIEEFPRNFMGKILRSEVEKWCK